LADHPPLADVKQDRQEATEAHTRRMHSRRVRRPYRLSARGSLSWERVLGFRPSELRARPFLDFVHPDDLDATIATVGGLTVAGSEVLNFQNRFRCKRAATAATGQHCHDTEHHHLRCPVDHSFPDHMPTVSEAPRRATIPAPRADTSAPDRAALEYGCAIDTWPGRVHEDALVREHV
jgi:hypothetical protein